MSLPIGRRNPAQHRRQSLLLAGIGRLATMCCVLLVMSSFPTTGTAQTKRVIIIKVDGLPYEMVERFASERDSATGKSLLPWFDHIFFQNGTRLTNFYVRGMSLSAPSWSELDTGQHLQVKGNVEFDRNTLETYDYLGFIPFYFKQATRGTVDPPGTEVLDTVGVRLLADAYDNYQRRLGGQLYERGSQLATIQRSGQSTFLKNPIQLAGEFITGFDLEAALYDQMIREMVQRMGDPRVRYLDLWSGTFDHVAHHNNDRESHLEALREIDQLLGRFWTAIQESPLADGTVLIVVSDHGFNSDEHVISQGFNLVKLLGSTGGGGHHVVTKRRLMLDYSIKSINPFVPQITTTTEQSYYLKGQSTEYPTALLDFDGNERSGVHLRNSNLNRLHLLLLQLQRKDLSPQLRSATTDAFFQILSTARSNWQKDIDQLDLELGALHRAIEKQTAVCAAQPKKFSIAEIELGRDDNARRACVLGPEWMMSERRYKTYVATMRNLLSLQPAGFNPAKLKIKDFIPELAMGARNSIYDLQNYVVGLGRDGLVLQSDGSLDMQKSFTRLDYFKVIHGQRVLNSVQSGIGDRPIDFIASRIPLASIAPALSQDLQPDADVVWVYGGPDRQALILARGEASGQLRLKYLPIANLRQDAQGVVRFDQVEWRAGFPLHIVEDPRLDIPRSDSTKWLNDWHTDTEWLHALHKTQYSNGLIGLHEQLTFFPAPGTNATEDGLSADERLVRAFRKRQRTSCETDLLIFANNHWNFDVRGFNPGGNHGSLLRVSTHSTLMLAGGERAGIPAGLAITEPYDSLSFVPTILALTGNLQSDNRPVEALTKRGFTRFPGRVISEIVPDFGKADVKSTSK